MAEYKTNPRTVKRLKHFIEVVKELKRENTILKTKLTNIGRIANIEKLI